LHKLKNYDLFRDNDSQPREPSRRQYTTASSQVLIEKEQSILQTPSFPFQS